MLRFVFDSPALATAALLLLISAAAPFPAGAEEPFGVPGADAALITECRGGTAYTYNKYIIYTRQSPSFEGQDIYIFEKGSGGQDPCAVDIKKVWYVINAGEFQGANTFAGVYGNDLFIDQWPGQEHKRLLIIDIGTKSLVFFDWYDAPAIEYGTLRYNRVLKARKSVRKKIPCPEAEKWEQEGKAVLYVEAMTLDLATMKKEASGRFSCKPAEAITKRAMEYNIH